MGEVNHFHCVVQGYSDSIPDSHVSIGYILLPMTTSLATECSRDAIMSLEHNSIVL